MCSAAKGIDLLSKMNRYPEDQPSSESPTHQSVRYRPSQFCCLNVWMTGCQVDGAIVHARSRLTLFKNHLMTLDGIMRSVDLDAQEKISPNKSSSINRSLDGQNSPRSSSVFSGDNPETMPGNKVQERPLVYPPSSRTESAELESQWRGSENGTFSDEHESSYLPTLENRDSSSGSSRSWSVGRPIAFGVSPSDQLLLGTLTRNAAPLRQRYEASSYTTDIAGDRHLSPPPSKKQQEDILGWILKSILPYACWPKEEALSDLRLPARDSLAKNVSFGKTNKINSTTVRVPLLSQAVRGAIGKMWDESCLETAEDIWQLLTEFLSNEVGSLRRHRATRDSEMSL